MREDGGRAEQGQAGAVIWRLDFEGRTYDGLVVSGDRKTDKGLTEQESVTRAVTLLPSFPWALPPLPL